MDEYLADLLEIDLADTRTHDALDDTERVMRLIETLVRHRKSRKISQKQVAAAMETTQSAVSDFERLGGDPRLSTLMRYARAVGMRVKATATVVDEQPTSAGWKPVAHKEESVAVAGRRTVA